MGACIIGVGSYIPERILTNDELAKLVDTSDEWITARTGIKNRHIALGMTATDMAIYAAEDALNDAGITACQVDLIIVATLSSQHKSPTTAGYVQKAIGAQNAAVFDINAACSGYLYALAVADAFIAQYETIMVIGAEKMSAVTDWSDRSTCVLLGDGAAATLFKRGERGVLGTIIKSYPDLEEVITLNSPLGSFKDDTPTDCDCFVHMKGPKVYKFATSIMCEMITDVIQKTGIQKEDVAYIIPHQANKKIIDNAVSKLGFPVDRYVVNISEYGNTSAASIPIALCQLIRSGKPKKGDKIILVAFGGGLTSAAAVVEY